MLQPKKAYKNKSEVKASKEQDYMDRAYELLSNPLTAFGYSARNEPIPLHLQRGIDSNNIERNILDSPLDILNPAFYTTSAAKGGKALSKGDIATVVAESLNFVPAIKSVGGVGKIAKQKDKLKALVNGFTGMDNTSQFTLGKGIINEPSMKKIVRKYGVGTGASGVTVKNYMQTPNQALIDNQLLMAKAEADAFDNPLAMGMQMAGQIGSSIAQNLPASTAKNLTSKDIQGSGEGTFLTNSNFQVMNPSQAAMFQKGYAAMGMDDAEGQIEAEGGEIVEAPGGEPAELKGPKHTQGGIDMNVPEGTKIYSDQLKGADGKTMADRKKSRERRTLKLDELLATSKGDKAIANSHQRMKAAIENEDQGDLQMQEIATQFTQMQEFAMGTGKQGVEYALGTPPTGVDNYNPKTFLNNFGEEIQDNLLSYNPVISEEVSAEVYDTNFAEQTGNNDPLTSGLNFTTGDVTGLLGNAVSMFAPMNNTLNNRASDTPNVNQFEDYGQDALESLQGAKNTLTAENDNNLQRVTRGVNTAKKQSRNSASSINTIRATDLSADIAANDANANLSDQYAKQMMAMLGQETSLKANIDQIKMGGAADADLANRQDKDAFATQLGLDKATIGLGLQQTGKDLNQVAQNKTMMDMVNQMSKYFKFDKNNKIISVNKKTK